MKVVICGSIDFTKEIKEAADALVSDGHGVEIPLTSMRILGGELTLDTFKEERERTGSVARKIKDDVIRRYYEIIKNADAILVMNLDKNGVRNYIGGNTFLEIGFAHALNKKIFLWNRIPSMAYTDEIVAMGPVVIEGDIKQIR